mmetsp:Transcript_98165/g.311364  ORF Transcript_98165/g.311364 Transcript_98165/m.311364 type:complete len:266 (+) Transcript_98165:305-1102(+)
MPAALDEGTDGNVQRSSHGVAGAATSKAAPKRPSASSISAGPAVSAGAMRRTLPAPAVRTRRPWSCAARCTAPQTTASGKTTPLSSPSPRTARPRGSARRRRPARKRSPISWTFCRKGCWLTRSRVWFAAAHTRGAPAKVLPWSPGAMALATLSFINTAPMGKPPARGFASVVMSGTTPLISLAKRCPVRPRPHWTSSNTRTAPTSSQRCRSAAKNSVVPGTTPPSPCMGSTKTAHVVSSTDTSSGVLLNGRNLTDGMSGWKGAL